MKTISEPQLEEKCVSSSLQKKPADWRQDARQYANETCTRSLDSEEYYGCRFDSVTFTGSARGCLFADVIFDRCDFSNCFFSESVFRRVRMSGCRMMGTDFTGCTFQDVQMIRCHSDYANYAGSSLKRCLFQECRMAKTSLSSCRWNQWTISDCDLTECDFFQTSLSGMDLSDSVIDGFTVSAEGLKGVILNPQQALACCSLLGIHVK